MVLILGSAFHFSLRTRSQLWTPDRLLGSSTSSPNFCQLLFCLGCRLFLLSGRMAIFPCPQTQVTETSKVELTCSRALFIPLRGLVFSAWKLLVTFYCPLGQNPSSLLRHISSLITWFHPLFAVPLTPIQHSPWALTKIFLFLPVGKPSHISLKLLRPGVEPWTKEWDQTECLPWHLKPVLRRMIQSVQMAVNVSSLQGVWFGLSNYFNRWTKKNRLKRMLWLINLFLTNSNF